MALINFNLLASTFKYCEEDAQEELLDLLETVGDYHPVAQISNITGILVARTSLDLIHVINSLRQMTKNEPWHVHYILRLIPIESVIQTKLEDIVNAAKNLSLKMHVRDTFRITIEKRYTSMSSTDIIVSVGREINNKVHLENPDWIVLIEIIGAVTGISVLKPNQIFRSVIEKRKNSNK